MRDRSGLIARQLQQTDLFSKLPLELVLEVNENLTTTDKLSLADTCSTYRPLLSDAECTRVCTMAGLSIPSDSTAREMAKLLCRPRVGVCNWSYEGGVPKSEYCTHVLNPDTVCITLHLPRRAQRFLESHPNIICNPRKNPRCPPSSIRVHGLDVSRQDAGIRNGPGARREG
jgi:hypothetical protein